MKKHDSKNIYTLSIRWPVDFKKKKFVMTNREGDTNKLIAELKACLKINIG